MGKAGTYVRRWAEAAGVRALKTAAQAGVALVGVGAAMSDLDWVQVISVMAVAAVASVLTSLAGLPEVDRDGDGLADEGTEGQ